MYELISSFIFSLQKPEDDWNVENTSKLNLSCFVSSYWGLVIVKIFFFFLLCFLCYTPSVSLTDDEPELFAMFSLFYSFLVFNPFSVFTVFVHYERVLLKGVGCSIGSVWLAF